MNQSGESGRSERGHRLVVGGGARVRADVVDVYVFRHGGSRAGRPEFLQLLRANDPLKGTWQPVMGHAEAGESSVSAAARELLEEVGLDARSRACLGLWALEQVHPFYIAAIDTVVMSPRFACEVATDWTPRLNREHTAHRWTDRASDFCWPGQKFALREIEEEIAPVSSMSRALLRIDPDSVTPC